MRKISLYSFGGVEIKRVDEIKDGKLYIVVRDDESFRPKPNQTEEEQLKAMGINRKLTIRKHLAPLADTTKGLSSDPSMSQSSEDSFELARLPSTLELARDSHLFPKAHISLRNKKVLNLVKPKTKLPNISTNHKHNTDEDENEVIIKEFLDKSIDDLNDSTDSHRHRPSSADHPRGLEEQTTQELLMQLILDADETIKPDATSPVKHDHGLTPRPISDMHEISMETTPRPSPEKTIHCHNAVSEDDLKILDDTTVKEEIRSEFNEKDDEMIVDVINLVMEDHARDFDLEAAVKTSLMPIFEKASRGELGRWEANAESLIALIILTDQVPRILYPSSPLAYQNDVLTREILFRASKNNMIDQLSNEYLFFVCLALSRQEDVAAQKLGVRLWSARKFNPRTEAHLIRFTPAFEQSLAIIEKFGRFPQCNEDLGRESTKKERKFLDRMNF